MFSGVASSNKNLLKNRWLRAIVAECLSVVHFMLA
jgi:hypothetical protein